MFSGEHSDKYCNVYSKMHIEAFGTPLHQCKYKENPELIQKLVEKIEIREDGTCQKIQFMPKATETSSDIKPIVTMDYFCQLRHLATCLINKIDQNTTLNQNLLEELDKDLNAITNECKMVKQSLDKINRD